MRKRLHEAPKDELVLQSALQKALSGAPLDLQELTMLQDLDMGSLIIEHDMSFAQARQVVMWYQNERYRMNAQALQQPIEGWVPTGTRQGSRIPGIQESKAKMIVRKLINEELKRFENKNPNR